MKRITHLYYHHTKRKVTDQDGHTVSFKKAKKVFEAGTLTDYNLAMHTLHDHDYDTDAVEAHYIKLDGPRT